MGEKGTNCAAICPEGAEAFDSRQHGICVSQIYKIEILE